MPLRQTSTCDRCADKAALRPDDRWHTPASPRNRPDDPPAVRPARRSSGPNSPAPGRRCPNQVPMPQAPPLRPSTRPLRPNRLFVEIAAWNRVPSRPTNGRGHLDDGKPAAHKTAMRSACNPVSAPTPASPLRPAHHHPRRNAQRRQLGHRDELPIRRDCKVFREARYQPILTPAETFRQFAFLLEWSCRRAPASVRRASACLLQHTRAVASLALLTRTGLSPHDGARSERSLRSSSCSRGTAICERNDSPCSCCPVQR